MTGVRVIGVGSPAGDDQAGWLVVDALRLTHLTERLACTARIIALDRPGAQLICELGDADVIVLIDAICTGAPPGTIRRIDRGECIEHGRSLSGHQLGVASALALADALGMLPGSVWMYGIEMQSTVANCGPSHRVIAAAQELARTITEELLQKFGTPTVSTDDKIIDRGQPTPQVQPNSSLPAPR